MLTKCSLATIALLLGITALLAALAAYCKPPATDPAKTSDLRATMRQAWSYHAWYTREYYASVILATGNTEASANRLIENQNEIGQLFGMFYGETTAQETARLLREHIMIAVDVVAAAKAGDEAAFNEADARWHQNTKDIAAHLANASPHLRYEDNLRMLDDHLALLTTAVASFLRADYPQSIMDNDAYYDEALLMADHFTHGIIKQFPDRFK